MIQHTHEDVARWMLRMVKAEGFLEQDLAAIAIPMEFGSGFVHVNKRSGRSIDRKVLLNFRKMSECSVVYSRSEKKWRLREPGDGTGRQQ